MSTSRYAQLRVIGSIGAMALALAVNGKAQTTVSDTTSDQTKSQEPVVLSEFRVNTNASGYQATDTIGLAGTATPIKDLPVSMTVITSDFISDIGAMDFYTATEYVPGVTRDHNDVDILDFRGFVTGVYYNNGVRQLLPPATVDIDRIEILNGAAAIVFGETSPGGAVNFVTKQPLFTPHYSLELQAGSWNTYYGTIDLTGPLWGDKLAYRLVAQYGGGGESWPGEHNHEYTFAPSITFRPFSRTEISVNASAYQNLIRNQRDNGVAGYQGEPLPDPTSTVPTQPLGIVGIKNNTGFTNFWGQTGVSGNSPFSIAGWQTMNPTNDMGLMWNEIIDSFNATITQGILKDDGIFEDLEAKATIARGENIDMRKRAFFNDYYYSSEGTYTGPDVISNSPGWYESNAEYNTHYDLDLAGKIKMGNFTNDVLLGVTEDRLDDPQYVNPETWISVLFGGTPNAEGSLYDLATQTLIRQGAEVGPNSQNPGTYNTTDQKAGYLTYQLVFPNDKLRALFAIRRTESELDQNVTGSATKVYKNNATSPQYGLIYQVFPDVSIYVSRTESFQANLGRAPDSFGNPAPPITGVSKEAGIKTSFLNGKVTLDADAFQIRATGQSVVLPGVFAPNNPTAYATEYIGVSGNSGWELHLNAELTNNVSIVASYINERSKLIYDPSPTDTLLLGKNLDGVPTEQSSIWAKYVVTEGPLKRAWFGLGANYMSLRPFFNWVSAPAYTRFDASLGYKMKIHGHDTSYSLSIQNLFNDFDLYSGSLPLPPRTITFRIKYDL